MLETGRGPVLPIPPRLCGGSRLKMRVFRNLYFGTPLSARFAIQYFESRGLQLHLLFEN
jgi:hypothetical protein